MIAIRIRKPDEVIPFNELMASIPTFTVRKPACIGDLKVGFMDKSGIANFTEIKTKDDEAILVNDLKEFMRYLNNYIDYVEEHLKERTPKKVLLELISTEPGRILVEDMLKNSKFHPELNETISWAELM